MNTVTMTLIERITKAGRSYKATFNGFKVLGKKALPVSKEVAESMMMFSKWEYVDAPDNAICAKEYTYVGYDDCSPIGKVIADLHL